VTATTTRAPGREQRIRDLIAARDRITDELHRLNPRPGGHLYTTKELEDILDGIEPDPARVTRARQRTLETAIRAHENARRKATP
jgi:hypothetical protein